MPTIEDASDDIEEFPDADDDFESITHIRNIVAQLQPSSDAFREIHSRGFCHVQHLRIPGLGTLLAEVSAEIQRCSDESMSRLENEQPHLFLAHESVCNSIRHVENLVHSADNRSRASHAMLITASQTALSWPVSGVTTSLSSYIGPKCTTQCVPRVTDCTFNTVDRSCIAADQCHTKLLSLLLNTITPLASPNTAQLRIQPAITRSPNHPSKYRIRSSNSQSH